MTMKKLLLKLQDIDQGIEENFLFNKKELKYSRYLFGVVRNKEQNKLLEIRRNS